MEISKFKKINDYEWEIPKTGEMRVPGKIFASQKLVQEMDEKVWEQLSNVATLPGIQRASIAMADAHWGYGFPIGGVGAFDAEDGVVSVGGVGFDGGCGVRSLKTDLTLKEVQPKIKQLIDTLFEIVPAGLGSRGKILLSDKEVNEVLTQGAKWVVEKGYGTEEDLEFIEDNGTIKGAIPEAVSAIAMKREKKQVGTLGSGNHYLEVQYIDEIYDENAAKAFGLEKGQVMIWIHCGSRALGHQIGTDYLKVLAEASRKYDIPIRERELVCAPISSPEGQRYFGAMCCALNYAHANRQVIAHLVRESFEKVFPESKVETFYEISHNSCKAEKHFVEGKNKIVYVHRKGATRAFGPGREELPKDYRNIGQPVLIGGTMGTYSYILHGTNEGEKAFFSACFTGDTNILTNKGVVKLQEVYERFKNGEQFFVPSLNKKTLEIEWKPILDVMTREAPVIEVAISQTGRSKLSKLKTTPDHNFITINSGKISFGPVSELINSRKMVCLIDSLPSIKLRSISEEISPKLAYLVGALAADGYVDKKGVRTMFIQKKVAEKLPFIAYVQSCFQDVFGQQLKETRTKTCGGYIRGKYVEGTATEFICSRQSPSLQILKIFDNLPVWSLNLTTEGALNFLAGIIDGDGTWNPKHHIIDIFTGDKDVAVSILIACLKLGILPYISKQRGNCFIIQISEQIPLLSSYTKRVKAMPHQRKYGTKLFAAKQLFENWQATKWPFKHKAARNNFMAKEIILRYIHNYPEAEKKIKALLDSPLRMQRITKVQDLGIQNVFNITVADNHNYVVLTDTFIPVLVKNCHGAGRAMSRTSAKKNWRGSTLIKELEAKGVYVKAHSMSGLAEEAPGAYKPVEDVVDAINNANLARKVARLRPIGNIKG